MADYASTDSGEPNVDMSAIRGAIAGVVASAAVAAAVSWAFSKVASIAATNRMIRDVSGNRQLSPTDDEANLSEKEANGSASKSTLAHDDFDAQKGHVEASSTEAQAANTTASASDSGAVAARTKAGASDIETKALKLMS